MAKIYVYLFSMAYSLTLQECARNMGHPELIYLRKGEEQRKNWRLNKWDQY